MNVYNSVRGFGYCYVPVNMSRSLMALWANLPYGLMGQLGHFRQSYGNVRFPLLLILKVL